MKVYTGLSTEIQPQGAGEGEAGLQQAGQGERWGSEYSECGQLFLETCSEGTETCQ